MDFDDLQAQAQLRWRIAERGLRPDSAVVLADGGIPPENATVFGRFQECDYACQKVAAWGEYWVAQATPQPSGRQSRTERINSASPAR